MKKIIILLALFNIISIVAHADDYVTLIHMVDGKVIAIPNEKIDSATFVQEGLLNATSKSGDTIVVKDALTLTDETEQQISAFETKELERVVSELRQNDEFAWSEFDKPYFVFIHDDTNKYLEEFAELFMEENAILSAATIPTNVSTKHKVTLDNLVAHGGEILAHYKGSPKKTNPLDEWLTYTRDIKMQLEDLGFSVYGIIRADATSAATEQGEYCCQRYFQYANDNMGRSIQYNLPRLLMLKFSGFDEFMQHLTEAVKEKGIHAYGFHGGREDEKWVTKENLKKIGAADKPCGEGVRTLTQNCC